MTAAMIQIADTALTQDFPLRPFRIRHTLVDHPLLTLQRIVSLVQEVPQDRIEYNSGKVAVSQDPKAVPVIDLDPAEVVRSIETCDAWLLFKRVESVPAYRRLLEDALLSVAKARGYASLKDAGFTDIQGFLFVSSPNATTPFHLDTEDNLFVHIHGEKDFHIYNNEDRSIVSDAGIEAGIVKHRNLVHEPRFDAKATSYHLLPGDGCFVPYLWPHWIRTSNSYSISLAITWKTRAVRDRNGLHLVNSWLRGFGLPQPAPGRQPAFDAVKIAFHRTAMAVAAPLRGSATLRRVLRRIVLGKDANYFLRQPAKSTQARNQTSDQPA